MKIRKKYKPVESTQDEKHKIKREDRRRSITDFKNDKGEKRQQRKETFHPKMNDLKKKT